MSYRDHSNPEIGGTDDCPQERNRSWWILLISAVLLSFASPPVFGYGDNIWTSQDIGSPAISGSTVFTGTGSITLYGSGSFGGTTDSGGQFYWQPLAGDGALVARVTSVAAISGSGAMAGVLVRSSLSADSPALYTGVDQNGSVTSSIRTITGGATSTAGSTTVSVPCWLQVARSGVSVTASVSADGVNWNTVSSRQQAWNDTVYVGIAVTSGTTTVQNPGTFDNVTLTSTNPLGPGCGLMGEYYTSSHWTGALAFTRVDPGINFNWTTSTPGAAIPNSSFSVRWSGYIIPRYTESYTFSVVTGTGGGNMQLTIGGNQLYSGALAGSGTTSASLLLTANQEYPVVLDFAPSGGSTIQFDWSSANQSSEMVPPQQLLPPSPGKGRILSEQWLGITGTAISALTSSAYYPNRPTGRQFVPSYDLGQNLGANYGTRTIGYLDPPQSGKYTFWLSGACNAALYLGGTGASNLILTATNTGYHAWTASTPQTLKAGQTYFIQALQVSGSGAANPDNLAVGWTLPDTTVEQPIPGNRLYPYEAVDDVPSQAAMLSMMPTGHPSLYGNLLLYQRLAATVSGTTTPPGSWWAGSIINTANSLLTQLPSGAAPSGTNLFQIRKVLSRVQTLGLAYIVTGDTDYCTRGYQELEPMCGVQYVGTSGTVDAWPNWGSYNTDDLQYGEGPNAVATGYDLLYQGLTPAQRQVLYQAIIQRGFTVIAPQIWHYDGNSYVPDGRYHAYNHAFVNNSGAALAAMAIAPEALSTGTLTSTGSSPLQIWTQNGQVTVTQDSQLCQAILYDAVVNLSTSGTGTLSDAGPDGSWVEGADYWQYSAQYLSYLFSALETAGGGDCGLTDIPGQASFGGFTLQFQSPIGYGYWGDFGWNDSFLPNVFTSGTIPSLEVQSHRTTDPATFWYGWKFNQTSDAWLENSLGYHNPFDFIWYNPLGTKGDSRYKMDPASTNLPLDTWEHHHDFMIFRTAWPGSDPYAMSVFFKGGWNNTGHSMLQLGDFEIDALGNRFIWTMGHDNYTWPYFDTVVTDSPNRWSFYRCRAEGSNELVLNPGSTPDQDVNAEARVIYYNSTPTQAEAIVNITQGYDQAVSATNNVLQVLRGVQFNRPAIAKSGSDSVILQDELNLPNGTDLYSFMHYQSADDTSSSTVTNWGQVPAETLVMSGTAASSVLLEGGTEGNLYMQILSPPGAVFTSVAAAGLPSSPAAPSTQTANSNFQKLQIHLTTSGSTTICVWMVPLPKPMTAPTIAAPAVVPLKNWSLVPAAPIISSSLSATGTAGLPFTYQIAAANFPTGYNATLLPSRLTVNTTTGVISGTASASGTSSIALSTANATGTTTATLALTIMPGSYSTWRSQYFNASQLALSNVSGDTAAPAGDGISNLMKYALNLDPWKNGAGGLPKAGMITVAGTNYLTLTYTRVIGAADITYTPQVSTDLHTWNSGAGYISVVNATNNVDGISQTVTVQALVPFNILPGQFFRLNVTGP